MSQADTQSTLPSLEALLPAAGAADELVLTIVFHSDLSRIGEHAVVPPGRATDLGRRMTDFQRPDGDPAPLGDPHVSRRALQFDFDGRKLRLRRFDNASRCRLAAGDLFDVVDIDAAQLRRGVGLLLGHGVVLLARLGRRPWRSHSEAGADILLGGSARMIALREEIGRAARRNVDVLLRGETGCGKELAARALHRDSARGRGPFTAVNMAAIPADLAAAALFGNTRGAFTGADRANRGYFRDASGGTLFLDEIGDTAGDIQPQLLRALQQREVQPVGGAVERVDLRVISATDQALDDPASGFRAALRYRLGACEVVLPPLREHPEDIGELLLHFLRRAAGEQGWLQSLPTPASSPVAIAAWADIFFRFLGHGWPGNVRELAHLAQQVIPGRDADTPPALDARLTMALDEGAGDAAREPGPRRPRLQDIPDAAFDEVMAAHRYEIAVVARALGVSRAAVYRRIATSPAYRLAAEIPDEELRAQLFAAAGNVDAAAVRLRVSPSSLRARARGLRDAQ